MYPAYLMSFLLDRLWPPSLTPVAIEVHHLFSGVPPLGRLRLPPKLIWRRLKLLPRMKNAMGLRYATGIIQKLNYTSDEFGFRTRRHSEIISDESFYLYRSTRPT